MFTFFLPLLPKSVCFVVYWRNRIICDCDVAVLYILHRMYIFLEMESMSYSKLAAI